MDATALGPPPAALRPAWLPPGAWADRIAAHDWSGSPLGPPSGWPQSLRTALGLALRAPGSMVLLWGPEGILLFNEPAAALFGPAGATLLGRPVHAAFPHLRDLHDCVLGTCLGGEAMTLRDHPLGPERAPEGRESWFDIDYLPVPGEDGTPAGVLATIADVSARIRAERERREGEARLGALADNLPGALVYQLETSRDLSERRYRYVSASVERLLGIPQDESMGDPMLWLRRLEPGELTRLEAAEAAAARDLSVLDIELRWRRPGGSPQVARIVSRPRETAEGRLVWDGMLLDVTAAREAEAELSRTTSLLQAIGASTPDLIYAKDREGRLLYANPAVERLIGSPSAELLGKNERDWASGSAEGEAIMENDRRVLEEGRTQEFEEPFTGADGRTRIFRTVKSPLRDEDGAVVGVVGLSGDVTEARRAAEELRRLNAHLEDRVAEALAERRLWAEVFEATDVRIVVLGPDRRILTANRALLTASEAALGRRPQVGDTLEEAFAGHPEILAAVAPLWERALGGEGFSVLNQFEGYALELRFEPLRDAEGRVTAALQIATDVTERVEAQRRTAEAEAARREADALYRAYFQNTAEGLFVVAVLPDGGFAIEEVNPAHEAIIGLDNRGLRGKRLEEQLPPEIAAMVAANYRRVVETGEIQRYRESADLGGRVIHAETVLVPVRDDEGRIVRIVGSGRDMTAQVQAEETLRQSQKLESMGSLTGGVAHDFNNLLTPIIAGLDMLQRRGLPDDRSRRLVDGALQSAERARTLVQRLLAFARRQPLQPVPLDLGALVQGMADLVASTVGPRIRVEAAIDAGLPPVLADANQLEMAILNLAVNARDAMLDGGNLRIEARRGAGIPPPGLASAEGFARLVVADTGAGMDEATLARAVEPFFSTKGIGRGTGLGLSMVHGLASQLGGALALSSRPGAGTTVELWLPVAEGRVEEAARPAAAQGAPPPAGRALLVDDEELVRAATAQMLVDLGYEVTEADSAEAALRLLEGGLAPDLVVTDHLMPGMTGTELARRLRGGARPPPVLLISGYAEDAGLPADLPRLTKPFRQDELARALSALPGARRPA